MEKFKDRKEQREVTEVMNALLLPMLNYLNADTVIKVRRALYLLGEIEVEPQESDHKCHTCKHYTSGEHDGSCGSYICKEYSNWESEVNNE